MEQNAQEISAFITANWRHGMVSAVAKRNIEQRKNSERWYRSNKEMAFDGCSIIRVW